MSKQFEKLVGLLKELFQLVDILPRLKSGDSYGAHSGLMLE